MIGKNIEEAFIDFTVFFCPHFLLFRGFRQAAWFSTANTSWEQSTAGPQGALSINMTFCKSIHPLAFAFIQ